MIKAKIYVCSPLKAKNKEGITENTNNAKRYAELFNVLFEEIQAVAPHAYLPMLLDDAVPEERELALDFGQKYLELCSGMIVCGDIFSEGMTNEIERAKELSIPIFYATSTNICFLEKNLSADLTQMKGWITDEVLSRKNNLRK